MPDDLDLVTGEAPRDPEELEATAEGSSMLGSSTRMGAVHLTVSDLGRSIEYYTEAVGLRVSDRGTDRASFGVGGEELLVLVEEPGAISSLGYTGLYHFALLVPERRQLARWLAHAARDGVPLVGLSDHFVSEALYLADPDGHGIEIYWDRPRQLWEGLVDTRMTTLPLDVGSLLAELDDPGTEPFDGLPSGSTMGHVHLRVASLEETVSFYRDTIGFGLMAQLGQQAAFLGAGGYHHHLGANTWESAGAEVPPHGSAALRHATIVLADHTELEAVHARLLEGGWAAELRDGSLQVRDPSGNLLHLTS